MQKNKDKAKQKKQTQKSTNNKCFYYTILTKPSINSRSCVISPSAVASV